MLEFKIFTESKADKKFINDYVSEHFDHLLTDEDFYLLNSWSGYKTTNGVIKSTQQNHDNGKKTILILDADKDFTKRQTEVLADFQRFNIPVDLFLFPSKSKNGNLENLLTELAVVEELIQCFRTYENCVRNYNLPLDKSRIYAYLDALLPPADKISGKNDLRKEENRNYRNTAHWNLHHEFLAPFHGFMEQFLR